MDSIKAFLMVTVTMPVWALIAIFIAGLVADRVLKAVAWELDTNKKRVFASLCGGVLCLGVFAGAFSCGI
ncbi:hypothetical protein BCAL_0366 [Bifidobacterium callitrichos DSM 23973]|uniref:Uncharacterized protein n=1 Tax=Bifidobacterium callitrichos DSM 23973 TaxID=1437609 RepID=A0A087AC40_9BIFI|nr:hypothetical protein [Bifidobacterium callitrichos]KFI56340.1 hypothetical protein BCAL_0366 [Bifidobacterium callitrichos DSM 23973]